MYEKIGKPTRRKEDWRLLTGQGKFSDDFSLPGQTYAALVRSVHPHATLRGFDTSEALSMPGVLKVFTGADCLADGLGPIPHNPIPKTKNDLKLKGPGGSEIFIGPQQLLPVDKARHVGEALAIVIAETPGQAADAAERVDVDYEPLASVANTRSAANPGAPVVWDEVPSNVSVDTEFGDSAGVQAAFNAADHIVSIKG